MYLEYIYYVKLILQCHIRFYVFAIIFSITVKKTEILSVSQIGGKLMKKGEMPVSFAMALAMNSDAVDKFSTHNKAHNQIFRDAFNKVQQTSSNWAWVRPSLQKWISLYRIPVPMPLQREIQKRRNLSEINRKASDREILIGGLFYI